MKNWRSLLFSVLALGLVATPASWAGVKPETAKSGDAATVVVRAPATTPKATPRPTPERQSLNDSSRMSGEHLTIIRNAQGRIIHAMLWHQLVTTVGKNYLLTTGLDSGSATTTWFVGMLTSQAVGTGSCATGSPTVLTLGASATTQTGQYVTLLGAGSAGANLATQISAGATSATQAISPGCSTTVSSAVNVLGPTLAVGDTSASHANWSVIASSQITNSVWPTWTANGVASAGSITNSSSPAVITMGGAISTDYLYGLILTSNSALATTSGTIYSEGVFTAGAVPVGASYTVSDTYALSLSKLIERLFDAPIFEFKQAA